MNLVTLSTLISLVVLGGCSSSSSPSDEEDFSSVNNGNTQTLRLISSQVTSSNGDSVVTSYKYDESGNLIGSVIGDFVFTYNIEPDGKIIDIAISTDGVNFRAAQNYIYDENERLRRIDDLGYIEGVGVLGVSRLDIYKFENELATVLETRVLPFEEIALNAQVEDSAGSIWIRTEFEYDGERLVRELIDNRVLTDNIEDGVVDTQREYTYNSDGTLASALDTGSSSSSYIYTYEQGACNTNWGNSTHGYFCVVSPQERLQ